MAENSKISWTDHTFNPWMGCTKVSPGCKFCYAERDMDHRYGKVKWGPQGARIRTSPGNWRKPVQWNKDRWVECPVCKWRGKDVELKSMAGFSFCPSCGNREIFFPSTRQRVFCASLADIFESKTDQWDELNQWRSDLFRLIEETPNLDWLLLTKRIENVIAMIPDAWITDFPKNIWLGTSTENQKEFDERIPILEMIGRAYHPKVIFVSAEPLLSAIDMREWLVKQDTGEAEYREWTRPIDWVIVGGESGPSARPMHPKWAQDLRDQCQEAGVAFHLKQWGEWKAAETPLEGIEFMRLSKNNICQVPGDALLLHRIGKHAAGRLLDGRTWDQYPNVLS